MFDRSDIENLTMGMLVGIFQHKMSNAMNMYDWNKQGVPPEPIKPDFTLSELEEAQKFIDGMKR